MFYNIIFNYYSEYSKIITLGVVAIILCLILFTIAYVSSIATIKDSEKLSEYECGFEPFDNATRTPFDIHFYVVGISFLIFDVEVALLLPWTIGFYKCGWIGFITMLNFLVILTVGFFYEWKKGALNWNLIHENF